MRRISSVSAVITFGMALLAVLPGCGGDTGTEVPAVVDDLRVKVVTQDSAELHWLTPSAGGSSGSAVQYDIRYATEPLSEANWALATQVPDETAPAAAAAPDSFVVTGLTPNTEYHFGLKTRGRADDWSALSNIASARLAPPALAAWGAAGSLPGQFSAPEGIEVDAAGQVYVVDHGNYRVQVFSDSGDWVSQFGRFGNIETGNFMDPRFVTLDSRGHLCVSDGNYATVCTVNIVTTSGGPLTYVRLGWNVGDRVCGVAAAPDGPLFVVFNDRVLRYTPLAANAYDYAAQFGGDGVLERPQGIAVSAAGQVIVVDEVLNAVFTFGADGALVRQWGLPGGGDGLFRQPNDVAIDSQGRIYVVDTGNHRIQVFTAGGSFLLKWGRRGNAAGEFQSPKCIAIDSGDCVYVVDAGNSRIQKFGPVAQAAR